MVFRIIPKLDIKNNFLVKGVNMEGLEKIGEPISIAEEYYDEGADEIILQDCIASLYKKNSLEDIVSEFSKKIFIPLTVGGGIRKHEDIIRLLNKGADRVSINSIFFHDKLLLSKFIETFGSSTICSNLEVQKIDGKYFVYKDFGRNNTNILLTEWLKYIQDFGIGEIIITSIAYEGVQKGFDLELLEVIEKLIFVPILIHGGAGSLEDILTISQYNFISGVVLSSVLHNKKKNQINNEDKKKYIYEIKNELTINEIKNYLLSNNVEINH